MSLLGRPMSVGGPGRHHLTADHRERPEQLENQGALDFQHSLLPQQTLSVRSCPHLCSGLSPSADDGAPMRQHPPSQQDHSN